MQWYDFIFIALIMALTITNVFQGIMLWSLRLRVEGIERATNIHHETLVEHWKEIDRVGESVKKLDTRRY